MTELPLEQLSAKAREADILPGLKTPLTSINKMAKEGYMTIFLPGKKGVIVALHTDHGQTQTSHGHLFSHHFTSSNL